MALDEAPPFWWKATSWEAILLSPLAYLYGQITTRRMNIEPSASVPVPVICVGNFIAGGAGKTPTVQLLAKHVQKLGKNPGILSRGHGGAITTATEVRLERHNAYDVGDEALLHAAVAPTVICPDRPAGARLLVEMNCDLIIMDDGFQNPHLQKDFNLIVVDSRRGVGNGYTIPAGPMRVPLSEQLRRLDGMMIIGDEDGADHVLRRGARAAKPTFRSDVKVLEPEKIEGKRAFAFAGISDPGKFFATLEKNGVNVEETQAFGDHHAYNREECEDLLERADLAGLQLMTTTKDMARLKGMGEVQEKLAAACITVAIELVPDDPLMLHRIFDKARENLKARSIASAEKSGS